MMRGTLFWCGTALSWGLRRSDNVMRERCHDGLFVTIVPLWLWVTTHTTTWRCCRILTIYPSWLSEDILFDTITPELLTCLTFDMLSLVLRQTCCLITLSSLEVEAQWLGGRMPDSRLREPGHESHTYNGAVVAMFRHNKNNILVVYLILGNELWFMVFYVSEDMLFDAITPELLSCVMFDMLSLLSYRRHLVWQNIPLVSSRSIGYVMFLFVGTAQKAGVGGRLGAVCIIVHTVHWWGVFILSTMDLW